MLIHADGDAFFASVEARDDPSLAGVPFAVAMHVVMCPNYLARAHGIHGAMPLRQAQRLCPQLRVVEPRPVAYEQASADLFGLFREITPFVEPGSLEEAFLDVTLVGQDPVEQGRLLRERARTELGLPVSVGVGTTKLMAKVASRRAKPDGMLVISRREDRALRLALRIDEVWGVGPAKAEALRRQGIRTVGDLVDREVRDLVPIVGTMIARRLAAVAAGTDDATIKTPGERRSAGASRTLMQATRTVSIIESTWETLLDSALGRLPAGVEVTRLDGLVRFEDAVAVDRAEPLREAITDAHDIRDHARRLLASTGWAVGRGVGRMKQLIDATEARHPAEPHYYLFAIGVRRDVQGGGLGSALMQPMLKRCDDEGMGAYLENSKPRNEPFYVRHGFEPLEPLAVPDGCPKITPMYRRPR